MNTKPRYTRPLTIEELEAMPDEDIDFSDIPKLDAEFWKNAVLRTPPAKEPISLRLDQHVLEYFRKQGKGYQTRINWVLASYVEEQQRKARTGRPRAHAAREDAAEFKARKPAGRKPAAKRK